MENNQTNIDQLIKQKFDHFEAPPPEHIWSGVKAGIVATPPSFFAVYGKKIAIAAVFLVAVTAGLWYLFQDDTNKVEQSADPITQQEPTSTSPKDGQDNDNAINDLNSSDGLATDENSSGADAGEADSDENDANIDQPFIHSNSAAQNAQNLNSEDRTLKSGNKAETDTDQSGTTNNNSETASGSINGLSGSAVAAMEGAGSGENQAATGGADAQNKSTGLSKKNNTVTDAEVLVASGELVNDNESSGKTTARSFEGLEVNTIGFLASQNIAIDVESDPVIAMPFNGLQKSIAKDVKPKYSYWSTGLYFSPEIILNDFDSVTIEPTYSLGIEPTYYINKHWFVRFGIGASYSRDRGFATVDYMSNDLIGTYEDVYDISFDTIDGEIVPTFYTNTTEIWEDINHIQIRELTNKYIYLQMPALFGYYNQKSKFKWYIYGGPAFNFMISKQIEEPTAGIKYDSIIDLNNKLPERSPYYMQLWIGGGIEYDLGSNFGLAIEPSYRYYFNHVYKESAYKTALSGFSLRFGLVYTIK